MTPRHYTDAAAAPVPLPFLHGRYDVLPGMARLAAPAGGNAGFFVLGSDARAYVAEKLRLLAARGDRHRGAAPGADPAALGALLWETLRTVAAEHPGWLGETPRGLEARALGLQYTRDRGGWVRVARAGAAAPGWEALSAGVERWLGARAGLARLADCVALSMQEDWAVVRQDGGGSDGAGDVVEYVHVCFPSHWDPRRKLGDHFAGVHAPVANNGVLLKAHRNIVQAMVGKGPFVRHAWGVARDGRLDHHPDSPGDGVALDPPGAGAAEPAYLRVERQTTRGFPALGRALFTIRTYLLPFTRLRGDDPAAARALAAALRGMSAEERRYKGVDRDADALAGWLDLPAAGAPPSP